MLSTLDLDPLSYKIGEERNVGFGTSIHFSLGQDLWVSHLLRKCLQEDQKRKLKKQARYGERLSRRCCLFVLGLL
jgi:hypothetical protein